MIPMKALLTYQEMWKKQREDALKKKADDTEARLQQILKDNSMHTLARRYMQLEDEVDRLIAELRNSRSNEVPEYNMRNK